MTRLVVEKIAQLRIITWKYISYRIEIKWKWILSELWLRSHCIQLRPSPHMSHILVVLVVHQIAKQQFAGNERKQEVCAWIDDDSPVYWLTEWQRAEKITTLWLMVEYFSGEQIRSLLNRMGTKKREEIKELSHMQCMFSFVMFFFVFFAFNWLTIRYATTIKCRVCVFVYILYRLLRIIKGDNTFTFRLVSFCDG